MCKSFVVHARWPRRSDVILLRGLSTRDQWPVGAGYKGLGIESAETHDQ